MTRSLPLPTDLAGITNEWLQYALSSNITGALLRGHRVIDINRGTCTKVRLELDFARQGEQSIPSRVILKGGFEPHSRAMHGVHLKEAIGYRDVFPHSPLRAPHCWFAEYDPELLQGIVILEDLVARGVTFCDPLAPQTADEVARRLVCLARFHAMTWNGKQMGIGERFAWATSMFDNFGHFLLPMLDTPRWREFTLMPRGAAVSTRFHDPLWMRRAFEAMRRLSQAGPVALILGDTHLGNLYVDTDGEPGFFDPSPQRGPVMHEIAYHVIGAMDLAERGHHDRDLVAHYREELSRCGVDPPPLDELMAQFGAYAAFGYAIFLINESHFQPEAINTAYAARFGKAMLDHGTHALV